MSRTGWIIATTVALLAGAAAYAYWNQQGDAAAGEYLTEAVDRGTIAVTVTATGIVNPVTTVQVGTYVSGPIIAIDVDFNSEVRKGQRVAQIDPAQYRVRVLKAEASLATARARVEKARSDLALKKLTLERNRDLLAKKSVAQNEVDTARSQYEQAVAQIDLDEAGVQQAEAELAEARINLGYTDITSPVDGVVVSRNVDVGQTVAASFQTPTLFLIAADLTKMQVNASVSEADIGGIRAGQSATFTVDAYPGKQFTGSVVQVRNAPISVQNVVTYDVVVAVDNRSLELKPGMTANVTIATERREDVLRLPVRALRFNPERQATPGAASPRRPTDRSAAAPAVWVLQPDRTLKNVEVQLGTRNDQHAELLGAALQAGDPVVVAMQRPRANETPQKPPPFAAPRHR